MIRLPCGAYRFHVGVIVISVPDNSDRFIVMCFRKPQHALELSDLLID